MGKFQEFDKDNSGFVTAEEAVSVLTKQWPGISAESIKSTAKRFDTSGDDKMNYKEFVYFYSHCSAMKDNMMRQFDELDKDGSGVLEADELRDALMHTAGLKDYMAASLIDDFDLNKDKKINKKEFVALWASVFGGGDPEPEPEPEPNAEAPPAESNEQPEQSEEAQDVAKKGD